MDNLPCIKVDFGIEGKNFNLNEVSQILGVLPTESRGINDWPEVIKCDLTLPEELQPRCVWEIQQKMDLCISIDIPIMSIINQLKGREKKLVDYCRRHDLRGYLCVTIHADKMCLPEMVLSSYILNYFGKMNVEISFDIYTY